LSTWGISGDRKFGPFVFLNRQTDKVYHYLFDVLREQFVTNASSLITIHVVNAWWKLHVVNAWWKLNHIISIVRQILNQAFREQWIGRRGGGKMTYQIS
jgi:hypothetical protein